MSGSSRFLKYSGSKELLDEQKFKLDDMMNTAALSWAMLTYHNCILLLQRATFCLLVYIPQDIYSYKVVL